VAHESVAGWLGLALHGAAATVPAPPPPHAAARARVPALADCVLVPRGSYPLGEPGEERRVTLGPLRIGRFPVAVAHLRRFATATGRPLGPKLAAGALDDHPATDVARADAEAFCAWASATLGARVRLPTGDEWEAAARGEDARPYPWGETFDPALCACSESGWGWTAPVTAHPGGASACGAEQLAGNVWEWVAGDGEDGWGVVRGGSYLDHAWGVRASRALPADPTRPTPTTGFRLAIDPTEGRAR
jgi:formylglycine-generating enzyme required for sulfatase activity